MTIKELIRGLKQLPGAYEVRIRDSLGEERPLSPEDFLILDPLQAVVIEMPQQAPQRFP